MTRIEPVEEEEECNNNKLIIIRMYGTLPRFVKRRKRTQLKAWVLD